MTEVAALAASTTRVGISDGRYSLGIGVGNSVDYDQIGVAADLRVGRFEGCVEPRPRRAGAVNILTSSYAVPWARQSPSAREAHCRTASNTFPP